MRPIQAIVWSVGVLLFEVVNGYVPFRKKEDILRADFDIKNSSLSKGENKTLIKPLCTISVSVTLKVKGLKVIRRC